MQVHSLQNRIHHKTKKAMAMNNPNDKFTLLVDVKTRKVACVNLHAVFGVRYDSRILSMFNWQVELTDSLRKVTGTREQWEKFAEEQNK